MADDAEAFLGVSTAPPASGTSYEPPNAEFEELQRVANYRLVRKSLRPGGIGSIIFGLIAIGIGTSGMEANPINGILALIGVFLTIEGIWLVSAPAPVGMIVDGCALLILGIWNISITFMNASSGTGSPGAFGIIGVWQIIWGFQSFGRYARFANMPQSKPSAETLQRIDQIVDEMKKATLASDPRLLEFTGKSFSSQQAWRGRLGEASGVFIADGGQDLVFAQKQAVSISSDGKVWIGKSLKATFSIGERNFSGTISPEAFQRYEEWKHVKSPA